MHVLERAGPRGSRTKESEGEKGTTVTVGRPITRNRATSMWVHGGNRVVQFSGRAGNGHVELNRDEPETRRDRP